MGLPTTNPAANAAPKPPVPGPGIPQSSPAPGNYPASPGYGGGQGAGYGYGGQEFTGVGDMRSPQR